MEQHDGSIMIVAGQMAGHWNTGRLDPLWLLEEEQTASFTTALVPTDDFSGQFVTTCSYQACGGYMRRGRQVYCDTCFSAACPKWNTSNPSCLEQEGHEVLPVRRTIMALRFNQHLRNVPVDRLSSSPRPTVQCTAQPGWATASRG